LLTRAALDVGPDGRMGGSFEIIEGGEAADGVVFIASSSRVIADTFSFSTRSLSIW